MRKPYIPILAFALLLLLCMPLPLEMATSVVPGWHTTIIAPQAILSIAIFLIFLIILFVYWRLPRKTNKISIALFLAHFLLTLPLVLYSKFFVFLLPSDINSTDAAAVEQHIRMLGLSWLATALLFLIGQILFATYAYKVLRKS